MSRSPAALTLTLVLLLAAGCGEDAGADRPDLPGEGEGEGGTEGEGEGAAEGEGEGVEGEGEGAEGEGEGMEGEGEGTEGEGEGSEGEGEGGEGEGEGQEGEGEGGPDLAPGDLVITEFMANPASAADDLAEYFEVLNTTEAPIDLQGAVLRDDDNDDWVIDEPVEVLPGELVALGSHKDGARQGFPVAYQYPRGQFQLANSEDEIVIESGGVEIDAVRYTDAWDVDAGVALQLDRGLLDAVSNDDAASWCLATRTPEPLDPAMGLGSPGLDNESCSGEEGEGEGVGEGEGEGEGVGEGEGEGEGVGEGEGEGEGVGEGEGEGEGPPPGEGEGEGPAPCPDENDQAVFYFSHDLVECEQFPGNCPDNDVPFDNDCGCGCIRQGGGVGRCQVDCDCLQGLLCDVGTGQCIAGFAPAWCCEKPGCPQGEACTDSQGQRGVCGVRR